MEFCPTGQGAAADSAHDLKGETMKTNIVAVELESRTLPGQYVPRPYTYYTRHPLAVGDIVNAPTQFGATRGRVARIDVPEHEIAKIKELMRTITEKPIGHEEPKRRTNNIEDAGGPVQLVMGKGGGPGWK